MNRRPLLYSPGSSQLLMDAHQPLLNSIRDGKIEFHAMGRSHYPGDKLTPGQLPGLLSQGYFDARGEQDWGMDFHRNEGIEICLLETGSMLFAVDNATHPLGPGCLTITRPWQAHRQGNPHIAAGRLHWATISVRAERPDQPWHWPAWVLLSREDREELSRRLRLTETPVWRAPSEVVHSFRRMAQALSNSPASRRLSALGVGLNELLLSVLDMLRTENEPEQAELASREHAVELFLVDLRQNLNSLERNWTLASMAEACGTGTTLFSRLCRRLTNASPISYLNLARLDAAARLLKSQPRRSVLDIAFDCGFQSSQYFAYQFRRRFGTTPRGYRIQSSKTVGPDSRKPPGQRPR